MVVKANDEDMVRAMIVVAKLTIVLIIGMNETEIAN